jgi:hypothetical protein
MQEGRAREDEMLLRLTTITTSAASSAVGQRAGAVEARPTPLSKASMAKSSNGLPLQADDLSYTEPTQHSEKQQGWKEASDRTALGLGVKTRKAARESGKSPGDVQLSRKRPDPVEAKPLREKTSYQGLGHEITGGWQSECDVVIFPGSVVQVR